MPSVFEDAAVHHPKAVKAGNDAAAFWHWAVMWSNANKTNGYLDEAILHRIPPNPISPKKAKEYAEKCADAWVKPGGAGLFERVEGGYRIHDFEDYYAPPPEPTAEALAEEARLRAERARAGRLGGERSAEARRQANAKQVASPGVGPPKQVAATEQATCLPNEASTKQLAAPVASDATDPSDGGARGGSLDLDLGEEDGEREQLRGDPVESEQDLPVTVRRARKRRTAIPADWRPTPGSFSKAAQWAGLSDAQALGHLAQFRDHHIAHGSLMASWDAAFCTWIRNTRRFERGAVARQQAAKPSYSLGVSSAAVDPSEAE